jgi:VanZ family protein
MSELILQKTDWRWRIYRYAPLVLWAGLVLFLSTGQASMSNTSRFIRPFLEFLFPNAPEEILLSYHGYIRKLAHITEYAILAFWAFRAFKNSSIKLLHRFWFVFAFIMTFLVASIDETNQSYTASRTGSIYDVMLDASGGLMMVIVCSIFYFRKNNVPDNKANQ